MRPGILCGLFAAILISAAAHAKVIEEFKAEDWDGMAFGDDATGAFTNCAVYAKYKNGATLFFIRGSDQGWYFSVSHDGWTLTKGTEYPIRYKVDRRSYVKTAGEALDTDQIGVAIGGDDPLVGQIRRGNRLTAEFQGTEYTFELSNSNKALNAAEDCVERHMAAAQPVEAATPAPAASPPATTGSDAPAAVTGEQRTFGPWVVAAAQDSAGAFANCTAFNVNGDDQLILSYYPDKTWGFGLYRPSWALDTGQIYYLWYNIDAAPGDEGVVKRDVKPAEPTRLYFDVGADEDIIARLEKGSELNLQLHGVGLPAQDATFSLDQGAAALAATRDCTEHDGKMPAAAEAAPVDKAAGKRAAKGGGGATAPSDSAAPSDSGAAPAAPTPPAATTPAPEPSEAPAADRTALRAEAAGYTTALLIRSGYPDQVVLKGDDVPEAMRSRDAAWEIGEIMGVTDIVDAAIGDLKTAVETTDRQGCGGTFTNRVVAEKDSGPAHIVSLCDTSATDLAIHYVIVPRQDGGYYQLSFIATGDGAAVESVATKVYDTAAGS